MCLSCGKTFNKEPQVKIHLNVHNGDNIYNCRFCEKVFANYSAFEVSWKNTKEFTNNFNSFDKSVFRRLKLLRRKVPIVSLNEKKMRFKMK